MADEPSMPDAATDVEAPASCPACGDAIAADEPHDCTAEGQEAENGAALEVHQPSPGTGLLPSENEWHTLQSIAKVISESGIAPKVNGRAMEATAIAAISLKGRELGIPPMQALAQIHMIEGRPTLAAELMRALVQRAGHLIVVTEMTPTRATVTCRRNDWPESMGPVEVQWTIEEAKKAGLENKSNWKKHPADMLAARATSRACRQHFADVLMGASYTPDEMIEAVDYDVTVEVHRDQPPASGTAPAGEGMSTEPGSITDKQKQRLAIVARELGMRDGTEDGDLFYRAGLEAAYGVKSSTELSEDQGFKLIRALTAGLPGRDGAEGRSPEQVAEAFLNKGAELLQAREDERRRQGEDVVDAEVVTEGEDG